MTYNPLTIDTAQTPERRREEADRILKILDENLTLETTLTDRELAFVEGIEGSCPVSPKQILWLRDLKAKYVE